VGFGAWELSGAQVNKVDIEKEYHEMMAVGGLEGLLGLTA
jgi:hypothetical protein